MIVENMQNTEKECKKQRAKYKNFTEKRREHNAEKRYKKNYKNKEVKDFNQECKNIK